MESENSVFWLQERLPEVAMDHLWSTGWRRASQIIYQTRQESINGAETSLILPLRVDVKAFQRSKSQQRIWKRNQDLQCLWQFSTITIEQRDLFDRHRQRFKSNQPESLEVYVDTSQVQPCETRSLNCYANEQLLAVSYVDQGCISTSALYGMFDPQHHQRSLGIYTLLVEIEEAKQQGKSWHYLGYATKGKSFYDYKKAFAATQYYDWQTQLWLDLS